MPKNLEGAARAEIELSKRKQKRAAILAAIENHPSKVKHDDGTYTFEPGAYTKIAKEHDTRPEDVSRIAAAAGIHRFGREEKPNIGKQAEPKTKAKGKGKLSKAEREFLCEGIAKGFAALYAIVAQVRNEPHWRLEEEEGDEIANDLWDGVETFEGSEIYEQIIMAVSKGLPRALFVATVWRVTEPRITESRRIRHEARIARDRAESGAFDFGSVQGFNDPGHENNNSGPQARATDEHDSTLDFEEFGRGDLQIPDGNEGRL